MIDLHEEQKLVESAKNDIDSFGIIYENYSKKLYSFVFYMVRSHEITEDIVSSTFEKAMLNLERYEFQGYSFGAWLYRIARNLVYDRSKAHNFSSLEELDFLAKSDDKEPEQSAIENERRDLLKELMAVLKDDQREIIYLRYVQEYSIKEVCIITGKSEDSIKSLAKRGLAKLRELSIKYKNE